MGWSTGQVNELIKWIRYFACIEPEFNSQNGLLSFAGTLRNWQVLRRKHNVICRPLIDVWTDALKADKSKYPKHAVVFGAQADDNDNILAGYALTGGDHPMMVIDMVDIRRINFNRVDGELSRLDQSFNLFWVMTHELLGHFYLKLDHGERKGLYKHNNIQYYAYSKDETIIKMNEWRMDLGLPTRLQHPAYVQGNKREYIFIDYAPDCEPYVGAPLKHLPVKLKRRQLESELRKPIQDVNNGAIKPSTLELPKHLRKDKHYAIASYVYSTCTFLSFVLSLASLLP